jgi:pilus assembly protein Flp/PilA
MLKLYVKAQCAMQSLKEEAGQGMIEYTLLAALISIVAIAVLKVTGTSVNTKFGTISAALS